MSINTDQFALLANRLSVATLKTARLPEKVFRPAFVQYRFVEADSFCDVEFWRTLQFLAEVSNDDSVGLIAVEPDPLSYHVHFGHYGAVDINATFDFDEYQKALSWTPSNSLADALEQAKILAWLPPSLKWALWRERDPEMMLLAYAYDFEPPSDVHIRQRSGLYLLSAQDALDMASNVLRDRRARGAFARQLINTYAPGNQGDWQDSSVARALDIARKLITGGVGIIEGARILSALRFTLGDDLSEIFSTFTLIDSETDHLPVGRPRELWAPEALARKDPEIARSEQLYKDLARKAAKELIARLTASD